MLTNKEIEFIRNDGFILSEIIRENNFKNQREIFKYLKENKIKNLQNTNKVNRLIRLGFEIELFEKDNYYLVIRDL